MGPESLSLTLTAGDARVVVDPARGGRLASLVVGGHELLIGPDDVPGAPPIAWGCYPMAPWAGRIRHGRFTAGGVVHQLPIDLPPHAIHGTAYTSPWWVERVAPAGDEAELAVDIGHPWPWPAHLTQRIALAPDHLRLELRLTAGPAGGAAVADAPMPAMVGWHPWFRRHVGGAAAELQVSPEARYELDGEGIPTSALVEPGPGPWDDCFTGLRHDPVLRWPGALALELSSSCGHWVIFNRPDEALCVEPQTDAPDAVNRRPLTLGPGESLDAWFELAWSRDGLIPRREIQESTVLRAPKKF